MACVDKCSCGRTKKCEDTICIECSIFDYEPPKKIVDKAYENLMKVSDKAFETDCKKTEILEQKSARYNEGKIQTREIDPAFILGIGEVLTKSREKYAEGNWMKDTKYSTPYESLQRHLQAFWAGEEIDKESGNHHLLHCATNIMFLYYHVQQGKPESDDRLFKKKK